MVRRAVIDDIQWILKQTSDFADFYGSKIRLDDDKEHGYELIRNLVENHVVFVFEQNGNKKGFIAGMITPHHFNPNILTLCELLWWVPEDYRSLGVGKILLDAFVNFGKENCDWITFTMEENTPASDKPLLDYGFKFKEKTYLLEV
jgi:RimJ/RimL family protein N-acetyltransferase